MVIGRCNCGAVEFAIDSEISDVIICHCSICRKFTGNNGVAVVIVANAAFRWTRGEDKISRWVRPIGDWQSCFCRVCGSSLPVINDEARMAIPAGLISDGGQSLKVTHHIWVDSKADWDEICGSGKQHRESFEG